jgi:hypothetical protein
MDGHFRSGLAILPHLKNDCEISGLRFAGGALRFACLCRFDASEFSTKPNVGNF